MITMLSGWAIKAIAGTKEKHGETTFIMVGTGMPDENKIAEACLAGGMPLMEILSVQRSVPLAIAEEQPAPETP